MRNGCNAGSNIRKSTRRHSRNKLLRFLTDLGSRLFDVQGLSAEEGLQVLQDCIMEAAQHTYDKPRASSAQPYHKPWFDSECRAALCSYKEARQDPSSHVAKLFLKRFKGIVRRKKRHYTKHVAAKLTDLARESPAKFWKRFRQQGKILPIADLDKWMGHFEKLLNVPLHDDGDSTDTIFDMHLLNLPSADALNSPISSDEVRAAIKGLLANGTFSVSHAMTTLRDKWFTKICQSDNTKVKCFIDNMFFDSDHMVPYLLSRPYPALFALIKFRLGSHWLRIETDRWLPVKPPKDQRICRHCDMNAVEDEQHFLFHCPLYNNIREQHTTLFGSEQGSIRLFLERSADQMSLVAHYFHLCFQARMSDESHLAPHPGL
ncbi:MAG: hypothetical protein FRX49_05794 [Trebouxia sp. A1-2]|nr:MAG: hypothetical protein FRX49_05794 [Trebouxia sp. A1-2]